jgi:hypothetical protein
MTDPQELTPPAHLRTAVARYDDLRARDALATDAPEEAAPDGLWQAEVLEMLARAR